MGNNLEGEISRMVREEVRRYLREEGAGAGGREGISNRGIDAKSFLLGTAAGLALGALWPQLQPALKASARRLVQGLGEMGEQVKTLMEQAKEVMEDIVAEAQFEKMKGELDKDTGGEG